ncbi:acyltransferase [Lacinutrix neustonica]|uniref:Acyltransferase n=1 Tax=Lacinutrix neustonica TaxID=2980107 RepID=A0A9E8MWG7_9FLAO|nr:acyltransferase [Lacinutrix neustonica]WAC02199.1 acyltransferase [Lacinutrix neustonica]
MKRLPNLNPLRFVLAFLVLIFHLPQLSQNQGLPYYNVFPIFHKGTEAVYMFFVLSGFLIISQIYKAQVNSTFSVKNFYARRALRILPLYFLIVSFGLLFYNIVLPVLGMPFEVNYEVKDLALLLVFPNVFSTLFKPGGILEILWSIGIEEQFYLMIAPLMLLIKNTRVVRVLVFITVLYFLIFHFDFFYVLRRFQCVYFFILSGGIIALLETQQKLTFLKKSKAIPLLIVVLTLFYFFTNWLQFDSIIIYNLVTAIVFSLFIHTISFNTQGFVIKNKGLNYLGTISYGIYMYHVIVLNAMVFLFLQLKKMIVINDVLTIVLLNVLTLFFTILLAHFSYNYFETYFLKLKNKYR